MIIGIGTDIVSVSRFKREIEQFNQAVLNRLFTSCEQEKANRKKCETAQLGFYAKRFAAKEAFSKALGSGIGKAALWTEIEVDNDDKGAPILKVFGKTMNYVLSLIPQGYKPYFHISLADEKLFAIAVVIIEAIPVETDN